MRLYKRGLVWFCAFYDDSGRRQRRSTRSHDRRAAETRARAWEQAAAGPAHAAQAACTVEDALDSLLTDRRELVRAKRRSQETVDFYEKKAGHLVRLLGSDTQLASIDARALD